MTRRHHAHHRWQSLVVAAAMGAVGLTGLLAPTARAAQPCPGAYTFTGREQICTVPPGVRKLNILTIGAPGGSGGGSGGGGATAQADVPVTPGQTLYIEVGGAGGGGFGVAGQTGAGGWNGGGSAQDQPYVSAAGGGGGASDVRTVSCGAACPGSRQSLSSRLLVAAGGGGAGSDDLASPYSQGGPGGDAGKAGGGPEQGGTGGSPGEPWGGGLGGTAGDCGGSSSAQSGSAGTGGSGTGGGGGGGGGSYGGGAGYLNCGNGGAGGGGGSSMVPSGGQIGLATRPAQVVIAPPALPTATAAPTISGTAVEGQELTEGHAVWVGADSVTYQWSRCDGSGHNCVPVTGATSASYVLGPADVGSSLSVAEVASNAYGDSLPVAAAPTAQIISAIPSASAAPSIVGPAVAGQTLAVQRGVWTDSSATLQYQWLRCSRAGTNCQALGGRTGLTYGLTGQDVGSTLEVQEVAVNVWGASAPAVSAATVPIADAPLGVQAFALVGTVGGIVPGPVASFSQPGAPYSAPGTYSAMISWGDGTNSRGAVRQGRGGADLIDASHAYKKPGDYSVTVRVTAATGAAAQGTNRVSVFAAAVCPKGSGGKGHNCLGQISLPAGCLAPGAKLRVSIPSDANIAAVSYSIDGGRSRVPGRGGRYAADMATRGLTSGTHRLTAWIRFRSGHPPTLTETRKFAIC